LTASDVDNADNSFNPITVDGDYGTFTLAADGQWTFVANSAFDELNVGDEYSESFDVTSIDGTPSTVTITIEGSNDAAIVSSVDVTLTETDAALTTGGTLTASDVDNADNSFNPVTTVGSYGSFTLAADGTWTFTANSAFDELNVGDEYSETFDVTSIDGTPSTVTITIEGTNDAAIVSSADITLTETDAALTTGGTLTADDVDNADNSFNPTTVDGDYGIFTLAADGQWTFTANSAFDELNVGDEYSETFDVTSIDGTPSTVTITIEGSNDAAIVSSADVTLTETDLALTTSGTLTADDVDNADNSFNPITVDGDYGTFTLAADGHWSFVANSAFDELNVGDEYSETFDVTSIDGTPSTVTITIEGSNDAAIVSSADVTLTETDLALTTSGTLTASDVDNADNSFNPVTTVGDYGIFTLAADGQWTFTANSAFNELNVGDEYSESFDVTSIDGTPSTVTITIEGSNDLPIISYASDSSVSEEGLTDGIIDDTGNPDTTDSVTASGTISIQDVDSDALSVALSGPTGLTSAGETIQWSWDAGSQTLTGFVGTPGESTYLEVMSVELTAPAGHTPGDWGYNLTLLAPLDHLDTHNEDVLSIDIGIYVNDGNGGTSNGSFTVTIEDDAPEIADSAAEAVTDTHIPDSLIGEFSFTEHHGRSNSLDFDGFTITARGFASWNDSTLVNADIYGSSYGLGVSSVGSPYHNIANEVDFRHFADGSEASEELVITLDPGTIAYGVNIEFASMFGGELEVGVVEFYRDGQLIGTQTFSSDAADGDYAASFEALQGGFDQIIIKATDNGFNAAHGDNSDITIKSIEFLGTDGQAIGYTSGTLDTEWGADGVGSLVFTGSDENALLTATGESILITQSGNTMLGKTSDGELIFKIEFTPGTGQWEFYQFQLMQSPADGQIDFNVVATDGDGDSVTGNFAVTPLVDATPISTNSSAQGTEDTSLILQWSDLNVNDADTAQGSLSIKAVSLPDAANGSLQHYDGASWAAVTLGMQLTSAMFDSGQVRFTPNQDQADGNFGGMGNQADALASFTYIATDGTTDSNESTVTIHISADADAPELSATAANLVWIDKAPIDTSIPDNVQVNDEVFGITIDKVLSGRSVDQSGSTENNYLTAMGIDETNLLKGGSGDDILIGRSAIDFLVGGEGDDIFIGGGQDDFIYGGSDTDTAIYSGNFADYTISNNYDQPADSHLLLNDNRGIDASSADNLDVGDHLYGIERLIFADGVYLVGPDGSITQLQLKEIPLDIDLALADTDGSETLSDITISDVPDGVYLSAGVNHGNGSWTLSSQQLTDLKLAVEEGYTGDLEFALIVSVTSTESSNNDVETSSVPVNISLRDHVQDSGSFGDDKINGTENNDFIVSDSTGIQVIEGENYNIAFILDSSGSMGSNNVDTTKVQLLEVFNTLQASATGPHGGVVNILLVDFDSGTKVNISVNLADTNAISQLEAALDTISSGGRTNYEAAFESAIDWFNHGEAASNDGTNLTYFITDGETNNYVVDTSPDDVRVYNASGWKNDKQLSELLSDYVPGQELIHEGKVIVDEYGNVNSWSQARGQWKGSAKGVLNQDENGDYVVSLITSGTSSEAEAQALTAFAVLNTISDIEAIGIGNGIDLDDLVPYDSDGLAHANINASNLANIILGSEQALIQGDDRVDAAAGNDIIFGDLVKFDNIEGQGYAALQKYVAQEMNQDVADVSVQDVHEFVIANPGVFDVSRTADGADTLYGGDGDDLLFGQGGNDLLIGGSGEDTLIGGLGDDTLTGGSGADTFVWSAGSTGTDHITDFNLSKDKLDLSDLLQGENTDNLGQYLHFTVDNGTTTIEIDANNDDHVDQLIVLDGVDLSSAYGTTDEAIINGLLGSNGDGALIIDNQASASSSPTVFADNSGSGSNQHQDEQIPHLIP
ncbi:VCBS domain-containing protein, partial [Shewanella sp.]|uniref:VCBS domain-containing protein n=1 Tax=Shewanella sp. TaxID=50422 RepID=UPI001EC90ECD